MDNIVSVQDDVVRVDSNSHCLAENVQKGRQVQKLAGFPRKAAGKEVKRESRHAADAPPPGM